MNELPYEIHEKIYRLLHRKDKVECLSVCRAWKCIFEKIYLFSVVRLTSKAQISKLIQKMGREPAQRQRVERLIIEMKHIELEDIDNLSLLFSNIQEVVFYETFSARNHRFTRQLSPHTWSRTIRCIREKGSNEFGYNILKGDLCSVLTDISTCSNQFGGVFGGPTISTQGESAFEFIQLLENTPALKSLDIKNHSLKISDLELLHVQAPLLVSLSLNKIFINLDGALADVKPANSIVKLSVDTTNNFTSNDYTSLLKYFTKKYPKISDIVYPILVPANIPSFQGYMTTGLVPSLKQIAPYLKSLNILSSSYFQYVLPILDQNKCEISS